VRLFNKVILKIMASDPTNPIFRGLLARLGQTRPTATRKDMSGWQAFLLAWGRAGRWDFFNT
jgi:hypothetical protein